MEKEYLGDAVYVNEWDDCGPGGIVLTTEDGYNVTNKVYLEPEVLAAFLRYIERYKKGGI